ncbi:hypothetical protein CTT31_04085 [Pseudoalteromonas maricaloris]|uniref:hypothetical protein n=1 Tax=Pseudoalteromonas maricaloris TaxID=184924 RepID=UPI0021AD7960|nr:hypothetical protein [Pseudoalteromonas flavipulchra]USE68341.1 hypothetical protein CTT31_04085 [Pseudoalteromonas flavipulchra]
MKSPFSTGFSVGFQTWGWWVFPLLCVLPVVALWGNIPDNIRNGNANQLIISTLVYVLPICWAYFTSLKARQRYGLEHRLLKNVADKANQQRRSIITKDGKQVLDVTKSQRDPDYYLGGEGGGSGNETVASLMVQQLVKNAEEMRRDSDLTSQVFIRSLVPFKTAVQIPQQVALRIGILFTFIGLLIGLEPVANMFQGMGDQRHAIGELISGLTVAFGTSIAGLGAALMIQILVTMVDNAYGKTSRQLESAWMDLGHVLSFTRLEGDLPANVERLSDEIDQHRETVHVHTSNLIREVENLLKEGQEQRQIVADTYQTLEKNQQAIDTLGQAHQAHLKELRTLKDDIKSYESRWNSTLSHALAQADELGRERNEALMNQVSVSINNLSKGLEQGLATINESLSNPTPASDAKLESVLGTLNSLVEHFKQNTPNNSLENNLQQLITELKEQTNKGVNTATDSHQHSDDLARVLNSLNDKLDAWPSQSPEVKPQGRHVLGYLSASLLGGVFACIALLLGMSLIGEPAQQAISQVSSFLTVSESED